MTPHEHPAAAMPGSPSPNDHHGASAQDHHGANDHHGAHDHDHAAAPDPTRSPVEHWEETYAASPVWSGRVNETTAAVVTDLVAAGTTPGRALDLGCGEGADAIWLARNGWNAVGVDISSMAVSRARDAADAAGLTADRIAFLARDLTGWADGTEQAPDAEHGPYDLVCASFFHADVELARTQILRAAADALAPGGHLLVVSHAAATPGTEVAERLRDLLDPAGELRELALDPQRWETVLAESRPRASTGDQGHRADHADGVLLVRRLP